VLPFIDVTADAVERFAPGPPFGLDSRPLTAVFEGMTVCFGLSLDHRE
jgi:hypothetical protein